MPISQTWNPNVLTNAANAEGVTFERLQKLLAALKPEDLNGLIAYAQETPVASLADWRKAFPTLFPVTKDRERDDAEHSAVIRVAMTVAGGVAV